MQRSGAYGSSVAWSSSRREAESSDSGWHEGGDQADYWSSVFLFAGVEVLEGGQAWDLHECGQVSTFTIDADMKQMEADQRR